MIAFERQTQQAFIEGHVEAFRFFGGVFRTIRYDNLAAAVKHVLRGRRREATDRFVTLRSHYLFFEICAAVVIVALYRRYVQRRPLSGPGAYRFPSRGFGVVRMRERLRRVGVDPERLTRPGGAASQPPDLSAREAAEELERLRDLRDKGTLTEEDYERARERLRRY